MLQTHPSPSLGERRLPLPYCVTVVCVVTGAGAGCTVSSVVVVVEEVAGSLEQAVTVKSAAALARDKSRIFII
jgi:hypothetical protein